MSTEYRNNHYVPSWYQRRFFAAGCDSDYWYLDLHPPVFTDRKGDTRTITGLRKLGPRRCFAQRDLYAATFGNDRSTLIEEEIFGETDRRGQRAVDYYARFTHPWDGTNAFQDLMMYMSTQKLRTPKGLAWLGEHARATDREKILGLMIELRQLYCAVWTECVWQIANAVSSPTKFIVSDHPVTVYNRRCGPRSDWCRGSNDPDIRLHATHTLFPLCVDKILVLTNLSWVRNPYQSETGLRPNPNLFRTAMFKINDIQILRDFQEDEVREINFILKTRARRYIAAGEQEWLFPEKYVSKANWSHFGDGYLLMPDPRSVTYSTEIIIGHCDGTATAFDEYGRRPWQSGYSGQRRGVDRDWKSFQRFKGEFARLLGPHRRGRAFSIGGMDKAEDDEKFHQYHLGLERRRQGG